MTETAPKIAPESAPETARVVDLKQYRLALAIRNASRQQGELARLMRVTAMERTQIAEALQGAQRHLTTIADSYTLLLGRLRREKDFRDACLEATELDDLDEMVRRRDALVRELADIRHAGSTAPAGQAGGEAAK